ncbi:MAG: AAA family ATPase [Chloroflexi bacterium]|nr:AAA family ATPase [Chloroflexota bacterium]
MIAQKAPWLVQTKLHPPQVRGEIVPRQRLSAWLCQTATTMPITLISAPAGYGKTTLLVTLPHNLPDQKLAWLALDEEENDANNFLFALIAALQTIEPTCGRVALDLLPVLVDQDRPQNGRSEVRRLVGLLINDIQETIPAPFILILDDLHFITQTLPLMALDYLVERMPQQMHVVFATRRDPPLSLSRFRARRRLAELRLVDLRFTAEEIEILLNEAMQLNVSTTALQILQTRTEGWAAGLSLLANSLERMPQDKRASFIDHVAQTHQHIFDYLSDEVLQQQPELYQTFLLQTSILQLLTPDQCTAVTLLPNTEEILQDLYRRNVFILAVDSEPLDGRVYRYHALFAEFLRHRLLREMPDQVGELHRRAAVLQTSPGRAIHHFTRAQMWDEAAGTIIAIGEQYMWLGLLDNLTGWINLLPESTRLGHPRLAYLLGMCALQKGDTTVARRWLEEAQAQAQALGYRTTKGAALAALGSAAFVQLDFVRSVNLVSQALAYPLMPYMHVQALMARASVALFMADWDQASLDMDHAMKIVAEEEDNTTLLALMLFLGQEFTLLPGGLSRIETFCTTIQKQLGESMRPVQLGIADVMAFIHLRRGRLQQAIEVGERALVIKEQLGGYYPFLGMNAAMTVAAAHTALGAYEQADHYLQLMTSAVSALLLNQHTIANGLFPLARAYWLQGRISDVENVYAEMCSNAESDESPQAEVLRLVVSSFLQANQRDLESAVKTLAYAAELADQAPLSSIFVCPPSLQAYTLLLLKKPETALQKFVPILNACLEDGTPGIILQEGHTAVPLLQLTISRGVQVAYAQELLDILGYEADVVQRPTLPYHVTPLTERETQVLQLMATGASNKSIAAELVISLPTVKSHVSHILSKLQASSRGEAVARARTFSLV